MAIKERKQITGTTEQINAYEGHEGQIVWDKDKKTFVGMSGTAGKNYPLAQQAYVDEGLAGKEDKGVCLPLTGGTMLGDILFRPSKGEFSIGDFTTGARLALNVANRENFEGQVIMRAYDGTETTHCIVKPNGELRLNNNLVDSIVQQSDSVVRYASGLQIEWFNIQRTVTKGATEGWGYTYQFPFVGGKPLSVSLNTYGGWGYATTIQLEDISLTNCSGTLRRTEGSDTNVVTVYGIVIGYWK